MSDSPSRKIIIIFCVLSLGILAFVMSILFARATVIVLSVQEEVRGDAVVNVSSNPQQGEVAGEVYQQSISKTQQFLSTGTRAAGSSSTVAVQITSSYDKAQPLVVKTRLQAPDGTLFRLQNSVVVPALGTVSVDVLPDDTSVVLSQYQAVPLSIPGLRADMQKYFSATLITPLTDATTVKVVSQSDIDQALVVLQTSLTQDAQSQLRAKVKNNTFRSEGFTTQVVKKVVDTPVGAVADMFAVTMSIKVVAVFYDPTAAEQALRGRFIALAPRDRMIASVDQKKLVAKVESVNVSDGTARIRVSGVGTSRIASDAPSFDLVKLTGISTDAAKKYVEQIDGVASVSIKMRPFWASQMPEDEDRITIEVR